MVFISTKGSFMNMRLLTLFCFTLVGSAAVAGDKQKALQIVPIECVKRGNSFISHYWPYRFSLDSQNYSADSKLKKNELRDYHEKAVESVVRLKAAHRSFMYLGLAGLSMATAGLGLRFRNERAVCVGILSATVNAILWGDAKVDTGFSMNRSAVKKDISKITDAIKMGPSEKGIGLKVELL